MSFFNFKTFRAVIFIVLGLIIVAGAVVAHFFPSKVESLLQYFQKPEVTQEIVEQNQPQPYVSDISYEQAIIDAAKNTSPSVVSIVISKNMPIYEQQFINPFGDLGPGFDIPGFDIQIPQYVQKGSEVQRVGEGSGFIVSEDGMVVTNKHVVIDQKAEYTVLTSDGNEYSAKVLAIDPVQDLAAIKIQLSEDQHGTTFKPVIFGDSDGIQIGQTVIAIGNALGQFNNTVSVGVVSGLQRTISASNQTGSFSETLEGIIQTDAAINAGNSGGPLVNLKGEVIGVNTAMAQGAQGIGFAIPANFAQRDIKQVQETGKIVYPFLGIRYVLINNEVKKEYDLSVENGALILKGDAGESAITKGSAAEKAGLKENDIVLEVNGEKVTKTNSLAMIIQEYMPGDTVTLKVLRDEQELNIEVTLGERSE